MFMSFDLISATPLFLSSGHPGCHGAVEL